MQRIALDSYVLDVLSKSTVQVALRHLKRRGLVDPDVASTSTSPRRRVLRPWIR